LTANRRGWRCFTASISTSESLPPPMGTSRPPGRATGSAGGMAEAAWALTSRRRGTARPLVTAKLPESLVVEILVELELTGSEDLASIITTGGAAAL